MTRQVIIKKEKPPIYDSLKNKFGVDWEDKIIIAFNGAIWCKEEPAPQKIVHEIVHLDRQDEIGNDAWWKLYLENDQFRLEEEMRAYLAEAKFIKKNINNREHVFHLLREIAQSMSSSVYGNLISTADALTFLR